MDWNGPLRAFASRPEPSFGFLYAYNFDDHQPSLAAMEMKHAAMAEIGMDKGRQERKKRLTKEQLEALERSFQEEIKLEPERKMKLSRDLGLHPRQIAVWFQNRRARWKAKQLERLYDALKHEFDAVSKEKQKLQDEVMKLKAILRDQASGKKQVSRGYTEISGEETVESTSIRTSPENEPRGGADYHRMLACNYFDGVIDGDYNPTSSPCCPAMLPYP